MASRTTPLWLWLHVALLGGAQGALITQATCEVTLAGGKARLFRAGNPLVFAGAVSRVAGKPAAGDVVDVVDGAGSLSGWGVFNPHSMYRVRLLAHNEPELLRHRDVDELVSYRISAAASVRRACCLPSERTTAYRLINGEGDRLSGLMVDVFGHTAVAVSSAIWLEKHSDAIKRALSSLDEIGWLPSDGGMAGGEEGEAEAMSKPAKKKSKKAKKAAQQAASADDGDGAPDGASLRRVASLCLGVEASPQSPTSKQLILHMDELGRAARAPRLGLLATRLLCHHAVGMLQIRFARVWPLARELLDALGGARLPLRALRKLLKDPRLRQRASPDHHRVDPRPLEPPPRLVPGEYVAVADNRHRRAARAVVGDHPADQTPVARLGVAVRRRAPVDCHRRRTRRVQPLDHLAHVDLAALGGEARELFRRGGKARDGLRELVVEERERERVEWRVQAALGGLRAGRALLWQRRPLRRVGDRVGESERVVICGDLQGRRVLVERLERLRRQIVGIGARDTRQPPARSAEMAQLLGGEVLRHKLPQRRT